MSRRGGVTEYTPNVEPEHRYHIELRYLPEPERLDRLVRERSGMSYPEAARHFGMDHDLGEWVTTVLPGRYDADTGRDWKRDSLDEWHYRQNGRVCPEEYAERLIALDGSVRTRDLYRLPHLFGTHWEANGYGHGSKLARYQARFNDTTAMSDAAKGIVTHLRVHPYAPLAFFGVPDDDIAAWYETADLRYAPWFVHRYRRTAARYGLNLRPHTYQHLVAATTSTREGRAAYNGGNRASEFNGKLPLNVIHAWAKEARAYIGLGGAPEVTEGGEFASYVSADYGAASIKTLIEAGVSCATAEELHEQGVTTTRLKVRVQRGVVPLEWAIDAARARE